MSASAYSSLEQQFRAIALTNEISGMLGWDASAIMPDGGSQMRGEQLSFLAGQAHEKMCAPQVGDWLDQAEQDQGALSLWQRANLAEMRRLWRHATAVPTDLVTALTKASNDCEMAWREARQNDDFASVQPMLQNILNLVKEAGHAKAAAFDKTLYDALLDEFEPGGDSSQIETIFDDLAGWLPGFIDQVLDKQASQGELLPLTGPFQTSKQKELADLMMATVGFDFEHGRLDESTHPFCGGIPEDSRITTRYDEASFFSAMMGVLHETGHAIYEQGLPKEWRLQPVGKARGMTLHESQSLLIEMQASRSQDFFAFSGPKLKAAFGGTGPEWDTKNLYRHATKVERGFIRVDADEVTYPAHVILRFRLEKALLNGEMTLNDLPQAWGDGLESLLGIRPPNNRLGCLQDIHWYSGAWGYFPTYTLGAMSAAQLFAAAKNQEPSIPADLSKGDFKALTLWLKNNVHQKASSDSTNSIMESATGKTLSAEVFKRHLNTRYLAS